MRISGAGGIKHINISFAIGSNMCCAHWLPVCVPRRKSLEPAAAPIQKNGGKPVRVRKAMKKLVAATLAGDGNAIRITQAIQNTRGKPRGIEEGNV